MIVEMEASPSSHLDNSVLQLAQARSQSPDIRASSYLVEDILCSKE